MHGTNPADEHVPARTFPLLPTDAACSPYAATRVESSCHAHDLNFWWNATSKAASRAAQTSSSRLCEARSPSFPSPFLSQRSIIFLMAKSARSDFLPTSTCQRDTVILHKTQTIQNAPSLFLSFTPKTLCSSLKNARKSGPSVALFFVVRMLQPHTSSRPDIRRHSPSFSLCLSLSDRRLSRTLSLFPWRTAVAD